MPKLLYISGPCCSGKTTLRGEILRRNPGFSLIAGDDFWVLHEGRDFPSRVEATNAAILDSVRNSTEESLLVEWVPASGAFPNELRKICGQSGRDFRQVILWAPVPVLRARKIARDGNDDIGPGGGEIPEAEGHSLVLDTERLTSVEVAERADAWLQWSAG